MKNEHLIPPIVKDLCESLLAEDTRENEKANYYARVSAIQEYVNFALTKVHQKSLQEFNDKVKKSR